MNIPQFREYIKQQRKTEQNPNKLLAYRDTAKWLFECGGGKDKTLNFLHLCIEQQSINAKKAKDEATARVARGMIVGYEHLRDVLNGTIQITQDGTGPLWEVKS